MKLTSLILMLASIPVLMHSTVFLERSNQPQPITLSGGCIGYLTLEDGIVASQDFKQKLSYLVEHPLVRGIILIIRSPGGSAAAAWEIYEAVRRACHKKPIVSYIEEVCASGAYLTACATNKIVANDMALVGSIGVVRTIEKLEPTHFKRDGVKGKITIQRFKKGKFKQLGSSLDPIDEEETKQLEEEINFLYEQFCSIVAQQRDIPVDQVKEQESLVFTGLQALEQGLIDMTGTLDDALDLLEDELAMRNVKIRCKDAILRIDV